MYNFISAVSKSDLPMIEKAVVKELWTYQSPMGFYDLPTPERLAQDTSIDVEHVRHALARLESAGWVYAVGPEKYVTCFPEEDTHHVAAEEASE